MARSKQTARHSQQPTHGSVVDNPDLSSEELQKLKEIQEGSMQAELKCIDKKWTEQGQVYYAPTVDEEIPEQVNWWSRYALCIVRHMGDHTGKWVQSTSLEVNSEYLKGVLRDVIVDYPDASIYAQDIRIQKPYHCLFYYRHELNAAARHISEDSIEAQHHRLLMKFIQDEFKEAIATHDNLTQEGLINNDYLWTIFKPGSTIYAKTFGQDRAFTLRNISRSCDPPGWILNLEYVDFDGNNMGTRHINRLVPAFPGAVSIDSLSAFPIMWHPQVAAIQKRLIARGREWEKYAGINFRDYKGVALHFRDSDVVRHYINGRIVVDTKTFHRINADDSWTVTSFPRANDHNQNNISYGGETLDLELLPDSVDRPQALTDEQCMLASSMVRGFAFNEKKWLDLFIDSMSPIEWNNKCFDQLVLPTAQKDLVTALVSTHVSQRVNFDDIIKGKGKGLIFVLHGPPGVGKTLTAETVAEYSLRPLYAVSSGDLGLDLEHLDRRLTQILDMASTWKAVLLIDEADVFLEQRTLHDLQRNALVSIFLRVLEYYEGILFLTSNRVATFDEAFKSRIHVPLKYDDLTPDSRKKIWQNFLSKTGGGGGAVTLTESDYDVLAKAEINGRQIKNVVRTAESLANHRGEKLDLRKLLQVVGIQEQFAHELGLTNVVHVERD